MKKYRFIYQFKLKRQIKNLLQQTGSLVEEELHGTICLIAYLKGVLQMTEQLIVRDEILIEANSQKVWEVLTKPKYVAEWDELPENYPDEDMTEGSRVIWELPNGGQSITKIIRAVVQKELKIALHVSNWEVKPNECDVAYNYQLKEKGDSTLLRIEIGDFSLIKDGKMYYDASVEFASNSKQIIKKLSENLG